MQQWKIKVSQGSPVSSTPTCTISETKRKRKGIGISMINEVLHIIRKEKKKRQAEERRHGPREGI
jgi:transcriptional regulator of met regulon